MTDLTFSIAQLLQLVGVVQCAYVIVLTLIRTDDYRFAALPIALFAAIALGFAVQLMMSLDTFHDSPFLTGVYLFVETAVPPLMYLMILELVKHKVPAAPHWLILGLPLLAVPAINIAVSADTVCVGDGLCVDPYPFFALFRVIAGVGILLLLVILTTRDMKSLLQQDMGKEKYWIVIALIGAIIALLTVNLLSTFEVLNENEAMFVTTALEIVLIYLLTSSLFRVYTGAVAIRPSPVRAKSGERGPLNDDEMKLVERITELMTLDKVYQEASYSRKDLAQELTIAEHQLSRIINTGFQMSFSDLINSHRVEEAKYMLRTSDEPVSTIAFDVGFNSLASFNRVFRKVTDQTPTAYRQSGDDGPTDGSKPG
jgi:AraC-like DNA-binding protein